MIIGIVCSIVGFIGLILQILSSIGHARNAAIRGFPPLSLWSPIGTIAVLLIIIGIVIILISKEKSSPFFRRNITPSCAYCKFGLSLGYSEVACSKRGIMSDDAKCSAFKYEPTKRMPEYANTPVAVEIAEEDMTIT